MDEREAVNLIKQKFGGRIIDPSAPTHTQASAPRRKTANESPDVPLMKMYKCQGELPGCGLSKPANEFYKEFNTLCSECALKLVRKHGTDLYWVPLIINCYEIARRCRAECERIATAEQKEAAFKFLVANKGIDGGRNHLVSEMIAGTKRAPMETEWVTDLYSRFKTWMLKAYGIENTTNQKTGR